MQKDKSNAKKINPFILFAFFLCSVIIALPLRVYQLMNIVESKTGFWSESNITVYILYGVLFLFAFLLPMIISFVHRDGLGKVPDKPEKNTVLAVICFLAAAALVYCAVFRFSEFSDAYFNYSSGLVGSSQLSLREYLTKSGSFAKLLEAFFAVISTIYFLLCGICNLTGKSVAEYKLLAVAPTLWCIFRILHRFMREISFLRVSELFLELCMIVFLMMFFMAYAQITARVNGNGLEWKLYGYGLPAAALCLVCFVPRVIVTLLGYSQYIYEYSSIEYCDLIMAIFVIGILVSRARVYSKPSSVNAVIEDAQAEQPQSADAASDEGE